MSSSLGFVNGRESVSVRRSAPPMPVAPAPQAPQPTMDVESGIVAQAKKVRCMICTLPVPMGYLAVLLNFLGALAIPLVYFYANVDYSSEVTKPVIIGVSAIATLFAFLGSMDSAILYNIQLGLYTGLEARVCDVAIAFVQNTSHSDADRILAAVGVGVILFHLIPFYFSDHPMIVSSLAAVGVVVNTSVLVYLDTSLLLFVFTAGITFFMSSMCYLTHLSYCPCMMTQTKIAMQKRKLLTFEPFRPM